MIRNHATRSALHLLGWLLLGACTSAPAPRTIAANHPALAGPAAPELGAANPLDTTVTYLPDGTRRLPGTAPRAGGEPGAAPGAGVPAGVAEYTCPMHDEVRAAEPGECPICGMDLVPIEEGGPR